MIAGTAIRKVSKGDKFESHSPIFAFNPLWDRVFRVIASPSREAASHH